MAEFPRVFFSGPTEVEAVFSLALAKFNARGITGVRMPFPAQPLDPARVSLKELAECQAMVLFLQGKYGTPWAELGGKSITEHEFLEAIKRQLPLFCFIDNSVQREPALQEFVDRLKKITQKTLIYEEKNFPDPKLTAERISSVVAEFRWVPPAFASFGEWENLLLAQYSRITGATVDRASYPSPIGRVKEREQLHEWLKDKTPEKNTALISGLPGFGKTLFAYHLVREMVEKGILGHPDILVIAPGSDFDLQSLREIVPDLKSAAPILLLIDDADERPDVAQLMARLASSPHFGRIKVLLTCQEGSAEGLYIKGYPLLSKTNSTEIHLKRLELDDFRAYSRKYGNRFTDTELVAMLKVTNGIPLYLDLFFNRGYQLSKISTHSQMEEYFLLQRLGSVTAKPDQLNLLKAMALMGSISLQHPYFKKVLQTLKLPDDVSEAVGALVSQGLIYRIGTRHRVTDRLVQDFVLAKYWTVSPDRDALLSLLSEAGELAPGMLENLARAEWVRTQTGADDQPFKDIWAFIEVAFSKSADSNERARVLRLLKDAAYFLPDLAFKLATATRARQLESLAKSESLPADELEAASDLGYSLGHRTEYFERALDILWDLGKHDVRFLNSNPSHAHRHLESLASLKPRVSIEHYSLIVDHVEKWLAEGKRSTHPWSNSPLKIVDELLGWEWRQEHYHKGAITLQRGQIQHTESWEKLRIRVVRLLGDCIFGLYGELAIRDALHEIRGQLPVYQHPGWQRVGDETLAQLRRAATHYLDLNRPSIPYVIFQQLDGLLEIFEKNDKEKIDAGSKSLRQEIQDSLKKRFPNEWLLMDATIYSRYDSAGVEDLRRAQNALVELGPQGAQALIDNLFSELAAVGIELQIGPLSLGGEHVDDAWRKFCPELYLALISKSPEPRIVGHSIALLWDCRFKAETDPSARQQYLSLLKMFPEIAAPADRTEMIKQLKGYVRWFLQLLIRSEKIHLLPEEIALVRSGFDSPDVTWSLIVKQLAKQDSQLAKELILTAKPGDDRKAADEVCSALISSKETLAVFSAEDWKVFLEKLEETPNLDDYWIEQVLIYASNHQPQRTAGFFFRRLERYAGMGNETGDYRPLPFGIGDHLSAAFSEVDPAVRRALIEEALTKMLADEDSIARYYLNGYVNLVAGRFVTAGLDILRPFAESSDPKVLEVIAGIVQYSYPNFVLDHPDFVEVLLNSAAVLGPEYLKTVAGSLWAGAGSRGYSRAIGQPSAIHVHLKTASQNLKRKFIPGTPTYEFYSDLEKSAESDIKREELDDEETLDD